MEADITPCNRSFAGI